MNIFMVDDDPMAAAIALCDRHVVKMILESAQLLSTAHRILDGRIEDALTDKGRRKTLYHLDDARDPVLYKPTHINHPSNVWTRTSIENYTWLVDHFFSLMAEYNHRYDKTHKCYGELSYMLQSPPKKLEAWDWTEMPNCMPEEYIISKDPVQNYRQYYRIGKKHLHKWTNRKPPEWL